MRSPSRSGSLISSSTAEAKNRYSEIWALKAFDSLGCWIVRKSPVRVSLKESVRRSDDEREQPTSDQRITCFRRGLLSGKASVQRKLLKSNLDIHSLHLFPE